MDSAGSAGSSSLGGADGGFGPCDSPNGLKLGKRLYVEDAAGAGGGSSSSRAPASRKGAGGHQKQRKPPICQVEGCKEDLTGVKAYYCKHKVCGMHSKSPKVIVAGLEQRFCQQCSRFHQLPEFDQGKRSCRRRLAGHNERRRKPPLSSLASRYGRLSSSFHDVGSYGGFLMDFSHSRLQSVSSHWQGGLNIPQSTRIMSQVIQPQSRSSTVGTLFSHQEIPPDGSFGSSDSSCALSLLSTQPWGANTTIASSRRPAISGYDFECTPMGHPTHPHVASTYLSTSHFKGQEINSSSYDIPCEMGLGLGIDPGNRRFSSELELAVQANGQCLNHAHGRAYGPPDNIINWSL